MFVKVCGITRGQDAEIAADLGASAIGFLFWPGSPRYIEPAQARAIAARMPMTVARIGVFVDEPLARVVETADLVGLDGVQLHGEETPEYCRQLIKTMSGRQAGAERWAIKAVGLQDGKQLEVADFDRDVLILVDAYDPIRRGGTGRRVSWDQARTIALDRRTILSGGLNAGNVAAAIEAVCPFGVDVSSGVEVSPGVKDAGKLKQFFEALNV